MIQVRLEVSSLPFIGHTAPGLGYICVVPFDRRVALGIQSNGPGSEGSGLESWSLHREAHQIKHTPSSITVLRRHSPAATNVGVLTSLVWSAVLIRSRCYSWDLIGPCAGPSSSLPTNVAP
jgi:hypothetical protein